MVLTSHVVVPKLSVFDSEALRQFLEQEQIKLIHLESIQHYVATTKTPYQLNFASIPDLPHRCIAKLSSQFGLCTRVVLTNQSQHSNTTKLLVQLPSGAEVETVIMHYDRKDHPQKNGLHSKPRNTVCISSQVGCKMACTFCATGTMGFLSQLSTAEILEQLVHANYIRPCKNVVFMGMGEPFDNYKAVCHAIQSMVHRKLFHLGPKHICVSTVGIISKMVQFNLDCPGVHLALSLHAPTQECREKIVPTARHHPLDRLMDAVDFYLTRHDRIMIEYILIRHLNSTPLCARQLGQLLMDRSVILNLIPYNPTNVNDNFEPPTVNDIQAFESILREEFYIRTTVRRTMGQDIDGACGQLVINNSGCSNQVTDIEDIGVSRKAVSEQPSPLLTLKTKSIRLQKKDSFFNSTKNEKLPSTRSSLSSISLSSSLLPHLLIILCSVGLLRFLFKCYYYFYLS